MRKFALVAVLVLIGVFSIASVTAQDPAGDWLAYALGTSPTGGIITYIEAKWYVPSDPAKNGAFYSPWFGIETSDNLNLVQPVNPWSQKNWFIYNEYFQWKPTHNENSKQHEVKAGDLLFGSVTFNPSNQSYTMFHSDLNDNWNVTTVIPVQQENSQYKNYTLAYFVFEKRWPCSYYPVNQNATFFDIKIEYDNQPVTPTWTTSYVTDICNCRAQVLSSDSIQITWTTSQAESTSKDDIPDTEEHFNLQRMKYNMIDDL